MLALLLSSLLASCGVGEARATWTIRFAPGDAEVSAAERARIDDAQRSAHDAVGATVCVHGHADDVGDAEDNWALGEARAANVVALLVAAGIDRARIEVRSAGETEPDAVGTDDDARAQNRRVVIVVVPPPAAILELAPEFDVLDLPPPPVRAKAPPAPNAPREAPPLQMKARPRDPPTWLDALEPSDRKPAGAVVVGVGAACGASVVLGACCLAPFTAPFGAAIAAQSMGLDAEPDALSGATVGAVAGALAGIATTGVAAALAPPPPELTGGTVVLAFIIPVATVLGAGVGAAAGWWAARAE